MDSEKRKQRKAEELDRALVWKNKGNEHFKKGDNKEALKCYNEAILVANDQPPFYSNRAQTLIKLNKCTEALADCDMGLKLDAGFVKLHIHRGRALCGLVVSSMSKCNLQQVVN